MRPQHDDSTGAAAHSEFTALLAEIKPWTSVFKMPRNYCRKVHSKHCAGIDLSAIVLQEERCQNEDHFRCIVFKPECNAQQARVAHRMAGTSAEATSSCIACRCDRSHSCKIHCPHTNSKHHT